MIQLLTGIFVIFSLFCGDLCAERYCVILAGGNGERLWPLSNERLPKQLLSVDGESTLLEQALDRFDGIIDPQNIWVCVTNTIYDAVVDLVGDRVGRIIVEPEKRDTAPAILYSCLEIAQNDPEAMVVFTPADAYIPHSSYTSFRAYLRRGYDYLDRFDKLLVFSMRTT